MTWATKNGTKNRATSLGELIHSPREERDQTLREMTTQVSVREFKDVRGLQLVVAVPMGEGVWGRGQPLAW